MEEFPFGASYGTALADISCILWSWHGFPAAHQLIVMVSDQAPKWVYVIWTADELLHDSVLISFACLHVYFHDGETTSVVPWRCARNFWPTSFRWNF